MDATEPPLRVDYQHRSDFEPLSRRDIATLVWRIAALYLLTGAISRLVGLGTTLLRFWFEQGPGAQMVPQLLYSAAPSAIFLAAGILLWTYSRRLTHWLFPEIPSADVPMRPAGSRLQAIAFSIVGIWLMVTGLSGALSAIPILWMMEMPNSSASQSNPAFAASLNAIAVLIYQHRGNMVLSLLQTIAGFALFLGATGLSRLWHRLRGQPMPAEPLEAPPPIPPPPAAR